MFSKFCEFLETCDEIPKKLDISYSSLQNCVVCGKTTSLQTFLYVDMSAEGMSSNVFMNFSSFMDQNHSYGFTNRFGLVAPPPAFCDPNSLQLSQPLAASTPLPPSSQPANPEPQPPPTFLEPEKAPIVKKWADPHVRALLDIMKERNPDLTDPSKNTTHVYAEIATNLNQLIEGTLSYTAKDIERKWNKLKTDYRAKSKHNGLTGRNRVPWQWMDAMHEIEGQKPTTEPLVTSSSLAGSKRRADFSQESSLPGSSADSVQSPSSADSDSAEFKTPVSKKPRRENTPTSANSYRDRVLDYLKERDDEKRAMHKEKMSLLTRLVEAIEK